MDNKSAYTALTDQTSSVSGESLRRQDLFRSCFAHASIGFSITDLKGRFLEVNPAYCAITGYTEAELRALDFQAITHREDLARTLLRIRALVQGQIPAFTIKKRYVRKDGEIVWVKNNVSLIRDKQGQATNLLRLSQDLTKRRRLHRALEESKSKFRLFMQHWPGYSWIKATDGRYIYMNGRLQDVLPRYRDEWLNKVDEDFWPPEIAAEYRRNDRRVLEKGRGLQLTENWEKDGEQHSLIVSRFPIFDETGKATLVGGTSVDITEQKRAVEALRLAEQRYHDIFENASEGIFQSTPEGRYIIANPALALMYGYSAPQELIDSCRDISPQIYSHSDRRDEFKRLMSQHGLVRDFEIQGSRQDGTTFWMSVNARAVRGSDGKIQYYEGTSEDITGRKRAEQALRDSEERYRDLVENSHELICTHALDGTILSINQAVLELLGYSPNEVTETMSIRDFLAPEVRDQFEGYIAQILKEGAAIGTMLVQTRSGERRLLEYYNSLRTEGVAVPIVRGIARDVTERRRAEKALRESEERYRELFENSRDAIYVHDMRGRYTSVNRAAEELSGYAREEIIGRPFWDFVAPEFVRQARAYLCQKLEEVAATNYEVEILTKNGRRIPVEVNSRLIYQNGVAIGVQGTARDIRERKRTQAALQNYSQRLVQAQETERRNIARELHDEIGQVLTAIKINLHTVRDAGEAEGCRSRIDESMAIVDEAITQVRELSLNLHPALLDDLGLTAALRWYVDQFAQRTGIKTEFVSDIDGPRLTHGLEVACFRIAQEALTNIARHARATKAVVQLRRSDISLSIAVSDNGIGFDLAKAEQQTSALGLRGMKERAHAAKGTLRVISRRQVGTEVMAFFRLKKE
jgi:PAS domain S-box-containing protein